MRGREQPVLRPWTPATARPTSQGVVTCSQFPLVKRLRNFSVFSDVVMNINGPLGFSAPNNSRYVRQSEGEHFGPLGGVVPPAVQLLSESVDVGSREAGISKSVQNKGSGYSGIPNVHSLRRTLHFTGTREPLTKFCFEMRWTWVAILRSIQLLIKIN
jgi:hypothetical protein